MNDTETPIRVQGLWKRYGLPVFHLARLARSRARALAFGAASEAADGPWALCDLNFSVRAGETLGIVGPNGAGKSTLLKILAGVTPPTRGRVDIFGRMFPMIELNAGLHQELTGRENVRLLGAVMGLPRREVDAKLPAMEEFSELGAAFERPVRTYSSGMRARLGFSVALNVDTEILLIDEVLAVGDVRFKNKCLAQLNRMRHDGRTRIFVSHNLDQVQYICDRCMVLDEGRAVLLDETTAAIAEYERKAFHQAGSAADRRGPSEGPPSACRVRACTVANRPDGPRNDIDPAQPTRVTITFDLFRPVRGATPIFTLISPEGVIALLVYASENGAQAADYAPGRYAFTTDLPALWFSQGRWNVNFAFRKLRAAGAGPSSRRRPRARWSASETQAKRREGSADPPRPPERGH